MRASLGRDLLLEIVYYNKAKDELQKLHDQVSSSLNYLPCVESSKRNEEIAKLSQYRGLVIDKLDDIKLHLPLEIRDSIIKTKSNYEAVSENILRLASRDTMDSGNLTRARSKLAMLKNDVVKVIEDLVSARVNLPSYEDIKKIKAKLRYQSASPVFTRESFQIYRRMWHAFGGSLIAFIYLFFSLNHFTAAAVLGMIAAIIVPLDVARLKIKWINEKYVAIFKLMLREHEKKQLNTTTYYLIGVLVSLILFPKIIACISILFLAFGDPVASIVGIRFGKNKLLWGKSLEGFLACFSVCGVVAYLVMSSYYQSFTAVFIFSVMAGFIGAVSEIIPSKIDDNVTIPIVSGLLMSGLYFIMF